MNRALPEGRGKDFVSGALFSGGTETLATWDRFIGDRALVDGEKEQTKTKKVIAQTEFAAQKALWVGEKMEWEEKCQELVSAGRFKGEAGGAPPT